MPKLKKVIADENNQSSQSYNKYLNFDDQQTQIPQPTASVNHQTNQQYKQSPVKKIKNSTKKVNKSIKKLNTSIDHEDLPVQKISKRKSKTKKKSQIDLPLNQSKDEKQNQNQQNSLSIKIEKPTQKRLKSQRKAQKSVKKQNKLKQKSQNQNQQHFNDNQLRQNFSQNEQNHIFKSQSSQKQNQNEELSSSLHFNKRLKKKRQSNKQQIDAIFSCYAEDQSSVNYGNRTTQDDDSYQHNERRNQSDLSEFDLLAKKTDKKPKKQKQIKIKNKYFSDLSFQPESKDQYKVQGQDPPQNSQELIFEKKQPRKTGQHLNQMIEKRVNHIKDRRQFKGSENDLKFKNHLKSKLQEIKDVQEVEINIQVPNVFTKKTACAALYMKNTVQKQQKGNKSSQISSQNQSLIPNKIQKTQSISNINLKIGKSEHELNKQRRTQQQFQLKIQKKGVKRQDFFNHLTKQIKTKRQTNITSQQIKDCFKTSTLDQADFDIDLADQALSNCSSRSGSRSSGHMLERRMSVDSQHSRKSQALKKQNQANEQTKNKINSSISTKPVLNKNININENHIDQNQNSISYKTNANSRRFSILQNPPISEVKQSDASSSIPNINNSRHFNSNANNSNIVSTSSVKRSGQIRFDDESIKQEVQKAYSKSYQLLQSDKQYQNQKNNVFKQKQQDQQPNSSSKSIKQIIEHQKQMDNKLAQKLKKISKNQKLKKINSNQQIDNLLQDNNDEQSKSKRKHKKSKKSKKFIPSQALNTYFQDQAQYSSSQQGHTDSDQQDLPEDMDEKGNLKDLISFQQNIQINQKNIRKKFLQDEQKRDDQIIDRLMKGLYGRKKVQQTESQKRMRQRMEEAAERNKLQDFDDNKLENWVPQKFQIEEPIDIDKEQKQKQMKKLKQLENELIYGRGDIQDAQQSTSIHQSKNKFDMIMTVLPAPRNQRVTVQARSGTKKKGMIREKSGDNKKSLLDLKSNNIQQQIHNKRMSMDNRKRGDSMGNKNKLQKTGELHLDIRDRNVNLDEDIQI